MKKAVLIILFSLSLSSVKSQSQYEDRFLGLGFCKTNSMECTLLLKRDTACIAETCVHLMAGVYQYSKNGSIVHNSIPVANYGNYDCRNAAILTSYENRSDTNTMKGGVRKDDGSHNQYKSAFAYLPGTNSLQWVIRCIEYIMPRSTQCNPLPKRLTLTRVSPLVVNK
jgi:hypothetical protein